MAYNKPEKPKLTMEDEAWQALELIADKWTLLVLDTLASGTLRHGQLQRAITGISAKMLTQTLRRLERDGLVTRKVYPVIPPKVEYSLTPLGRTVLDLLQVMCQWAKDHWHEVLAARSAFQERQEPEDDTGRA